MGKPGRPRTKVMLVESAAPEAPAPQPPEIGADEFIGAFPNGKITVWERVRDKQDALVGTFEADGDVQNRVAALVGGGDYVWKLRLPNGVWASEKKDGVPGQGKFSISVRAFPKKDPTAPAAAVAPAPGGDFDLKSLFLAQMQQTTQLLTALVSKPQADPISMLSALKNLMPAPTAAINPLDTIATTMELMRNAQEMAPGRGGGGGGGKMEDRIWGLLEAAAPAVANRMLAPGAPPAAAPARPTAVPPPGPVPELAGAAVTPPAEPIPVAENPIVEGDEVNLKKMAQYAMISGYIPDLVDLARRGRDPDTYADVFLDQAEKKNLPTPTMVDFFSNEKLVAELTEAFPIMKGYGDWFEAFRESVLRMLTQPAEGVTLDGDAPPSGAPEPSESSDA